LGVHIRNKKVGQGDIKSDVRGGGPGSDCGQIKKGRKTSCRQRGESMGNIRPIETNLGGGREINLLLRRKEPKRQERTSVKGNLSHKSKRLHDTEAKGGWKNRFS